MNLLFPISGLSFRKSVLAQSKLTSAMCNGGKSKRRIIIYFECRLNNANRDRMVPDIVDAIGFCFSGSSGRDLEDSISSLRSWLTPHRSQNFWIPGRNPPSSVLKTNVTVARIGHKRLSNMSQIRWIGSQYRRVYDK